MDLNPAYTCVGTLFENKPMFFIPKYQRAYAWETESIKDFIKDLKACFLKRKAQAPISHFWGGILSVEYPVQGVVRQHQYEIIDGQQRAATFTILMACIVKMYKELLDEATSSGETTNESILKKRIEDLSNRFINFNQEVQRVTTIVEVLKLSKPDHNFYRDLITEKNPSPSRDSHKKLLEAYKSIFEAIQEMIGSTSNLVSKMDDLEVIQNVIDSDFTVLHMVTKDKKDAFRLFQVINDRGTSLTEGDLLRAKTLEILEGFSSEQNSVEELWDKILSDHPNKTANYLHWIYESNKGRRAPQNALFDKFMEAFFPQHTSSLTQTDADKIYKTLGDIEKDIIKCRKLENGEWLYADPQPITGWEKSRLNLLLKELDHTLSIPLLLAASQLRPQNFSQIVQIIEKAFFRYKIICNQHASALQTIYREQAILIRNAPANYQIRSLEEKLRNLINNRASAQEFQAKLEWLEYKESGGGSNKPLKYFLLTAEYYYPWFKKGVVGVPNCLDKTRVYDFASTSIEHIYPQNATSGSSVFDSNLEPLKHSLGNLTILGPALNGMGYNDAFVTKKPIYQSSSVFLTKDEIGQKAA